MAIRCFILILLISVLNFQISLAENVKIKSQSKGDDGKTLILAGIIAKPDGNGPFPTVVLLHGGSGLQFNKDNIDAWSRRLVSWGYVTLALDSLEPRRIKTLHGNSAELFRMVSVRAIDAYDAKSFLANFAYVDQNRIAVIGWSHGGMVVLSSVVKLELPHLVKNEMAFKAGIAFYPYCDEYLNNTNAPLLILIGESDDIVSAESCSQAMSSQPQKHEVFLKIYPEAYHGFDWKGKNEIDRGHKLLYNPEAAKRCN